MSNFEELKGKIITNIVIGGNGDDYILFETNDEIYKMYHDQDCCEYVYIESVVGDINDILNSPILIAEEATSDEPFLNKYDYSYTWTFYKLDTIKGGITIRWYGTSNGYYSESVDFKKIIDLKTVH